MTECQCETFPVQAERVLATTERPTSIRAYRHECSVQTLKRQSDRIVALYEIILYVRQRSPTEAYRSQTTTQVLCC